MDSTVPKHFANGHIAKHTPEGFVLFGWTPGTGEGWLYVIDFCILAYALTSLVNTGLLASFPILFVVIFVLLTLSLKGIGPRLLDF